MPNGQNTDDVTFTPPTQQQKPDTSDVTFTPPSSGPARDPFMTPGEDIVMRVAKGALEGAGDTVAGVSSLIHKIPGVGEMLAPAQGTKALSQMSEAQSTPEHVGKGLEAIGEFAAGDEALTGVAKLAKIAQYSPEILKIMETYPKASKAILNVLKAGTVGAAQGAVKAPEGERTAGAEAGGAGGAGGALAGEVIGGLANTDLAKAMMNRASGMTKSLIRYGQDPAQALIEEKELPVFSTLTNKGRMEAATTLLNKVKPELDAQLDASPTRVDPKALLQQSIADARKQVDDSITMTDVAKKRVKNQIAAFEKNIAAKFPNDAGIRETNDLKTQIGREGAEFDSKPDATDIVRNLYTDAYANLKGEVNKAVPQAVELNRRIANLNALRDAAHETVLAERAGQGPMSGMGHLRDVMAMSGHVAPAIARMGEGVKAVAPVLGSEAAQTLRIRASDGSEHEIPADKIDDAKIIDPHLTVLGTIGQGLKNAAQGAKTLGEASVGVSEQ